MRYLNTKTLRQQTESNSDNIIDTDARVSNWFKICPDGYKGEWVGDTYTFVLIPPPTQDELDAELDAKVKFDALQYQRDRETEYPTIADLVVALYDTDDKSAVEAKRAAVKLKYPKPE
jgi:hypothetical protein